MVDNINNYIYLHICKYCNKNIVRLNNVVCCSCGEAYHASCAELCATSLPGEVYRCRCCTNIGGIAIRNDIQIINPHPKDNILASDDLTVNHELINTHDSGLDDDASVSKNRDSSNDLNVDPVNICNPDPMLIQQRPDDNSNDKNMNPEFNLLQDLEVRIPLLNKNYNISLNQEQLLENFDADFSKLVDVIKSFIFQVQRSQAANIALNRQDIAQLEEQNNLQKATLYNIITRLDTIYSRINNIDTST